MRLNRSLFVLPCLLALLLSACLTPAPLTRFYALSPEVGPALPPHPASPAGLIVREVRVPGDVDRPQIVLHQGTTERPFSEFVQWSQPLSDNLARTLTTNLQQRLPQTQVVLAPLAHPPADWPRLTITVLAFDLDVTGSVDLNAQWMLSDAAGTPLKTGLATLNGQVKDSPPDTVALLRTMNGLVGQLSDQIAQDWVRRSP